MEVNTAFDWAGRAIVTQNRNAQRALCRGNFTHTTKCFCKGNNSMKDVYDAKFLRVTKHFIGFTGATTERYNTRFRIALQSNITFF